MKLSALTFSTARMRLAGLQIDGAVDIEPLTARRLLHRKGEVLAGPAAGRPHLMGRMNRIDEGDGLTAPIVLSRFSYSSMNACCLASSRPRGMASGLR